MNRSRKARNPSERTAKPSLVVTALAPVLRGQPGRNPGDNDDTTRHLSGRSVRVLAFLLRFLLRQGFRLRVGAMADKPAEQATRKRAAGKSLSRNTFWKLLSSRMLRKFQNLTDSLTLAGVSSMISPTPRGVGALLYPK